MSGAKSPGQGSDPRRERLRELCDYIVAHWRPSHLYGMVLDVVEALASWVAWAEDMRGQETREEAPAKDDSLANEG